MLKIAEDCLNLPAVEACDDVCEKRVHVAFALARNHLVAGCPVGIRFVSSSELAPVVARINFGGTESSYELGYF